MLLLPLLYYSTKLKDNFIKIKPPEKPNFISLPKTIYARKNTLVIRAKCILNNIIYFIGRLDDYVIVAWLIKIN